MALRPKQLLPACFLLALSIACGGGVDSGSADEELSPVERPLTVEGSEQQGSAAGSETSAGSTGFQTPAGEVGQPAPTPQTGSTDSCPAGATRVAGDLAQYLASRPVSASGSEGFVVPTAAELSAFEADFRALLAPTPSAAGLQATGFKVTCHSTPTAATIVVVEDVTTARGGGTFAVNPTAVTNAWLEVPHALSDEGTVEQGAGLFGPLDVKAVLISGTHRCASAAVSSCSGSSAVCGGGGHRASDVAHFADNYFTAAHRALRAQFPAAIAVNLHGMDSPGGEKAVISDGTSITRPQSVSLRVRDAFNQVLPGNMGAFSCNDSADNGKHRPLCGTTNVQGRVDNGSPNACSAAAAAASDRFVHIEQSAELRGTASGGNVPDGVVLAALKAALQSP